MGVVVKNRYTNIPQNDHSSLVCSKTGSILGAGVGAWHGPPVMQLFW